MGGTESSPRKATLSANGAWVHVGTGDHIAVRSIEHIEVTGQSLCFHLVNRTSVVETTEMTDDEIEAFLTKLTGTVPPPPPPPKPRGVLDA
jgi:hypothetical protein